jgi:hypothetical protein
MRSGRETVLHKLFELMIPPRGADSVKGRMLLRRKGRSLIRLTGTARLTTMIEAEVQAAFVNYLKEGGWEVQTHNADHIDVKAWRGDEVLVAEVKGTTTSPGLDVDTAYGQLLRRMGDRPEGVRYALVVPDSARRSALRVSDEVRRRLGIEVWTVDEAGNVQASEPPTP